MQDVTEAANRQAVEQLFQALIDQDLEGFHRRFNEDSVIEFPQSGERIVGGERRRAVYRSFPGRPSVRRIRTGGDLAVAEASVDYGDEVEWNAVFIFEFRGAKVSRLAAYWARPFDPADSRAALSSRSMAREPHHDLETAQSNGRTDVEARRAGSAPYARPTLPRRLRCWSWPASDAEPDKGEVRGSRSETDEREEPSGVALGPAVSGASLSCGWTG